MTEQGERRGVSPPVQPSTGGLTPRRSPVFLLTMSYVYAVAFLSLKTTFFGVATRFLPTFFQAARTGIGCNSVHCA